MKKTVNFNSNEVVYFEKERVKALVFSFKALQSGGSIAAVNDISQISLDVTLKRKNGKVTKIVNDYLDRIMANYIGNSASAVQFSENPTATGPYNFRFEFGAIQLMDGDRLEVKCNAKNTAFTSLGVAQSSIDIETVPTQYVMPVLYAMDVLPIGNGEILYDKPLGDNVVKIVHFNNSDLIGSDNPATLTHFEDITLKGSGYHKDVSAQLLHAENLQRLYSTGITVNPKTFWSNQVLFESENSPLNDVHLKGKLSDGATKQDYVLVTRRVEA